MQISFRPLLNVTEKQKEKESLLLILNLVCEQKSCCCCCCCCCCCYCCYCCYCCCCGESNCLTKLLQDAQVLRVISAPEFRHTDLRTHARTNIHHTYIKYTHTYTYIYIHVHTHIYTHVYTYIYIHTQTYITTRTNIHTINIRRLEVPRTFVYNCGENLSSYADF